MKMNMKWMVKTVFVALSIQLIGCSAEPEKRTGIETASKYAEVKEMKKENENAPEVNKQNMQTAYKGEITAHMKYEAYSVKAAAEGHPEIALLFKAAAGAEQIHANNHKVVLVRLGETIPEIKPEFTVKTTRENLQEAINGESYEYNTMYPEFIKIANEAGDYMSQISLTYAYKVELKHRDFYVGALKALDENMESSLAKIYFLCPTCGNTYATVAPSRCEISMTDSKLFIKVTHL